MRPVFLSGPMAVGKSTVGPLLAQRLGRPFVDLDEAVTVRAGKDVARIFREDGEARFRALEAEVALGLAAAPGPGPVVALGGGTVTRHATRRALARAGTVLTLGAGVETLLGRLGAEAVARRPLLQGEDLRDRLRDLLEERGAAYAEAHGVVATDGRTPREVVLHLVDHLGRDALLVPLGRRSYRVEVGPGLRHALPRALEEAGRREAATLAVTDENVEGPWGADLPPVAARVVLPPGERHKTLDTVARLWDAALEVELDRDGAFLAFGGGVVSDLTGFAAATLYRGVDFVAAPTTVLAMADASVGGKTGFDRPEGKNLIGAFHQPRAVLCDVETLRTLDPRERRSGFAEVVKAAWIEGEEALAALEEEAEALVAGDLETTTRALRRAIRLKAEVVASDEREGGRRRLLNLGHTVGHALEAAHGFEGLTHGEAVSLGLIAAFRVAREVGVAEAEGGERRCRRLLSRLGLPVDLDAWARPGARAHLARDKKRVGSRVRFLVPGAPGQVRVQSLALERVARAAGLPSRDG